MNVPSISGISPINPLLQQQQGPSSTSSSPSSMFGDIYNSLIGSVNSTDSAFSGDIVKAAEGELDDPQQLVIDSTKANIALQLVSNVRNTALEAYNDVIKMSV